MVGLRPQTPGTVFVLAATVLLVIASVSVPIWKSIYFLSADLSGSVDGLNLSGTLTLGVWGYCINDICSPSSLGYNLDSITALFGLAGGDAGNIGGLSTSVIRGLTYVLILHPVAAGLAGLAFLIGLISHFREFSRGACTAFVASLAATVALLAFVFDIVCFTIAKNRINATSFGSNAALGKAVWITLAGMVLLFLAGILFCIGGCIVRKRTPGRQASNMNKPAPDMGYAGQMRYDADNAYGNGPMSPIRRFDNASGRDSLPVFYDKDGEVVPLRSYPDGGPAMDEEAYPNNGGHRMMPPRENSMAGSQISGVGVGYGRKTVSPPPQSPVSNHVHYAGSGPEPAGSRLAQDARDQRGYNASPSAIEPFVSMSNPYGAPQSQQQQHHDPYSSMPTSPVSPAHGGAGPYYHHQQHYPPAATDAYQPHYASEATQSTGGGYAQPAPVRPYADLKREYYPDVPPSTSSENNNTSSSNAYSRVEAGTPAPTYASHPQQQSHNFGDGAFFHPSQPQQQQYHYQQ